MKRMLTMVLALCLICACFGTVAIAEEPVKIRIMREERGTWYPEGEDMNDNILMDFVEEKLNVEFETAWAADNGAYASTLNMLIASNDLPDMFYADAGQMQTLYEYEMIQPIGQYFEEYLCEDALTEISWNNNAFLVGCTFDGEQYGFPCTDDFMAPMPMLYVRQDWLDNLGLEFDPDNFTLDDFLAMCEAFTNGDPDGNGLNDTYAYDFHGDSVNNIHMYALAHAMGVQTNMWKVNDEGELYFTGTTEEMKPLLSLLQDMYAKGYIAKDYVSTDYYTEGTADLSAGKVGIFPAYFWSGLGAPQTAIKTDPSIQFTVFPVPKNPDGEYNLQTEITCYRYLCVNSSFEHPELAVQYQQLWYDLWRGQYAEYYHGLNATDYLEAQEDFKYYVPFWWDPPLKNLGISNKLVYTLETGDESELAKDAEAYKMLNPIREYLAGNTESSDYYYGFAQGYNFLYSDQIVEKLYGATDASRYITNLAKSIPVDQDYAGIKSLLDDLHKEYYNKIIMGADLETTFAEYCQQWVATGGDELAEYYNEWYAANGEQFK